MKKITYLFTIILITSFFASCVFDNNSEKDNQISIGVLSAFGLMNENLVRSNAITELKNQNTIALFELKANEAPNQYGRITEKAKKLNKLTREFDTYIEEIISMMKASIENPNDYETMNKSEFLDKLFFKGGKLTPKGESFLNKINSYRDSLIEILSTNNDMKYIIKGIKEKFETMDLKTKENASFNWLAYHYIEFPLIASLTKLRLLQSDIRTTEAEVLSKLMIEQLIDMTSTVNYETALMIKNRVNYSGDNFEGTITLARKDAFTVPNKIKLAVDDRELNMNEYQVVNGQIKIKISAGSIGEHKITGNLIFWEDGEEIWIPIEESFTTIKKVN